MVSKCFYKTHIYDVQPQNCTESEIQKLLDIFESVIKDASALLVQKAEFHLSEFSIAKLQNLTHFSLHIERHNLNAQEIWMGAFRDTTTIPPNLPRTLKVMGSLERE
jgi:hypothetical protein